MARLSAKGTLLRAVIFDLDGVVIDSHPIHRRAWRRFLESTGTFVTEEQLEYVTQGGKREDILRYFFGNLSPQQAQEYGHRKEMLFREEALEVQPMHGLTAFLRALEEAQIRVAIASCGSRVRVGYVLERLGWLARFKVIVTGDDICKGKPDPTIFQMAAAGLGIAAESAVVIEDAVAGVEGAIAAGMKAVGVASNGNAQSLIAAGASKVVADFRSLSLHDLHELFDTRLDG